MHISFNAYNEANKPRVFLAKPNRKFIAGTNLNIKDLNTEDRVGIPSISFKIYKYSNNRENDGYNDIDVDKYIWFENIGWYRITDIDETDDGDNPFKEINAYDLATELKNTILTSFGSLGREDDEQGGLDRYALYDASDQAHSIAHIFMAKNPTWKFKHIDDTISKNHRSFDVDSATSYEFLVKNVAEAFECVFVFDSNDRTVSAYKVENWGDKIPLTLSLYNLIKEFKVSWADNDMRTVLHVSGGNDATGTALSIASVNPDGNDAISNFSYFYDVMSAELKAKLKEYYQLREARDGLVTTAISQLKVLQVELATLNSHEPSTQTSIIWSEYGLTQLKAKSAEYLNNITTASDGNMADPVVKQQYDAYADLYKEVNDEIVVRQTQITAKEAEVTAKKAEISSYVISMQEILGDELFNELQPYIIEDVLCDDSFIATDAMSDNEILEMKQALYEYGFEELNKICYPRFNMTIDSVNFPILKKYQEEVSRLKIGDILQIRMSDDNIIEARLLKMNLDWEDFNNFSLTFSSRTSLTDGFFDITEIGKMAQSTKSTLDHRKSGYSGVTKQANQAYFTTQKEFLDLSMQQIVSNGVNQEVIIDETGIMLQKYLPLDGKYAPEKMRISNRQIVLYEEEDGTNLKNPKLAIGKVYVTKNGVTTSYYGISSEVLYGRLIVGESLIIQNKNNTFTIDENGLVSQSTNGFKVQINPDDPSNILNISKNGTRLFYIDANTGKLVFKGRAEIDDGYIANWTITQNKLYSGGVGMSPDTAANAVSFWAGNETPTSAPFRVLNNGYLFASNANIAGIITATSGTIGGWTIGTQGLTGNATTYIMGGRLNIGNGLLVANYNEVYIGDFVTTYTNRALFMSTDQYSGMSASTASDRFALWGGYHGGSYSEISNYVFAVDGVKAYVKDLRVTGDSWWGGDEWTLTSTMEWMDGRIRDLEAKVAALGG